jgi:DNA processing protein
VRWVHLARQQRADEINAGYRKDFDPLEIRIIDRSSDEYPKGLLDLPDAPPMLWALGRRIVNEDPSIAIVGARACTTYGEHITREIVGGLEGMTIVSGAAYGIDAAAHRGALATGRPTIAYLAGGVDRPYPAGHADLIKRIAQYGTVLSETPPGEAPTRWRFLRRNRLIAAHARGMVVAEAGARSGSLNAANHAAGLERPIGAVPGPITSAASAGCHLLIQEGTARLVTGAGDVQRMLKEQGNG